jgi:hypothetical protein
MVEAAGRMASAADEAERKAAEEVRNRRAASIAAFKIKAKLD